MSQGLLIPTMVILMILIFATIATAGSLIIEIFTERKTINENVPKLIDNMNKAGREGLEKVINESGLMKRQRKLLGELLSYQHLPETEFVSAAQKILSEEEAHYSAITGRTDLICKLGPMFGLMGTLIPLGPGILALGQGDAKTLSDSLLIAFDTTVAGMISAGVATVISSVRKRWYKGYMVSLESLMECIIEEVYHADGQTEGR